MGRARRDYTVAQPDCMDLNAMGCREGRNCGLLFRHVGPKALGDAARVPERDNLDRFGTDGLTAESINAIFGDLRDGWSFGGPGACVGMEEL